MCVGVDMFAQTAIRCVVVLDMLLNVLDVLLSVLDVLMHVACCRHPIR